MDLIVFCNECRGMRVSWNRKYLLHCLACKRWVRGSLKVALAAGILVWIVYSWSVPTEVALSHFDVAPHDGPVEEASFGPFLDPALRTVEKLLEPHASTPQECSRIAQAVVQSGRRYKVDPKLVASVIIVESKAKAFAVSGSNAIGIMQIHLATWGETADRENVNLFKIEDNIDFGVRILKRYIAQYGLWPGVMRYKGWNGSSDSQMDAEAYVAKIRKIYDPQTALIQSAALAASADK